MIMYLCVYLFKKKPTGPQEVNFATRNQWECMTNFKIFMSQKGEGVIREGG